MLTITLVYILRYSQYSINRISIVQINQSTCHTTEWYAKMYGSSIRIDVRDVRVAAALSRVSHSQTCAARSSLIVDCLHISLYLLFWLRLRLCVWRGIYGARGLRGSGIFSPSKPARCWARSNTPLFRGGFHCCHVWLVGWLVEPSSVACSPSLVCVRLCLCVCVCVSGFTTCSIV